MGEVNERRWLPALYYREDVCAIGMVVGQNTWLRCYLLSFLVLKGLKMYILNIEQQEENTACLEHRSSEREFY